MLLRIGHTPDPDDAYMFYGIASGKVRMEGYSFTHVIEDIESLNRRALRGDLEITAISAHAYPYLSERYYILSTGASMGLGYGPMVVTRSQLRPDELEGRIIAVPGRYTTAALLVKMAIKNVRTVEANFAAIPQMVSRGEVDGGVLIHEVQLTYERLGLHNSLDLWRWWEEHSNGLPLPLGLDAARRDLGEEFADAFNNLFRESIRVARAEKDDSVKYAMKFARESDRGIVEKFVNMYVSDLTVDMGRRGREAIRFLFERAAGEKLIPETKAVII